MRNLLIALTLIAFTATSCGNLLGKRVKGSGNITSQDRSVSNFKNVEVSGAIDVYVAQGETKPVKVETDANLQEYIEVFQEGDKVIVRTKHGYNIKPSQKIKVYLSSQVYSNIDVSGACNIYGQNKIVNTESLSLDVSGAGDIKMEIDAPSVSAEVSGAGNVDLKGETKSFVLDLTGAGQAHCYELLSENTKVEISGAGDADVYASVKLDAQVSGAGSVSYKGGATSVNQHVSGAGSVKKVE